jgi:hypothetical protein
MVTKNPFMSRLEGRATGSHGNKSEARLAKSLGARQTLASGALQHDKSDMKINGKRKIRIEAKSTIHNSMSVELAWLTKIRHEAAINGAIPALTISFVTPEGKAKVGGDWVAVPLNIFKELTED